MRRRPLAAVLLALVSSGTACQIIWSYDDFEDRPGTAGSAGSAGSGAGGGAGSGAGSDAGSDAGGGTGGGAGSDDAGSANGLACDTGADCQSGNCEPGLDGGTVCCGASCGTCQTCDGDGGACAPVPAGEPGPGCPESVAACNGAGDCKLLNGSVCQDGGEDFCLSGVCTNGICCATECPACQKCAGDGSGCVNKPFLSQDGRCSTFWKVCDGNGHCA